MQRTGYTYTCTNTCKELDTHTRALTHTHPMLLYYQLYVALVLRIPHRLLTIALTSPGKYHSYFSLEKSRAMRCGEISVRFRVCRRRRFVRQSRECRRKRTSSELENWAPGHNASCKYIFSLMIMG